MLLEACKSYPDSNQVWPVKSSFAPCAKSNHHLSGTEQGQGLKKHVNIPKCCLLKNGNSMKHIPDTNQQKSNSKTMMCDSDYAGIWEPVGLDTLKRKNSADTICKTIFCNFCSYSIEIGATPVLQSDQRGKKTIKDFIDCSPKAWMSINFTWASTFCRVRALLFGPLWLFNFTLAPLSALG